MPIFAEIVVAAFVAGALGSLIGIGGGIVLVPFLTLVMGVKIQYAAGASIVSVIATSSAAGAAYLRERLLNLRLGLFLNMATAAGAVIGGLLAGVASARLLYGLFGLVLLYSAVQMFQMRDFSVPTEDLSREPRDRLGLNSSYFDASLNREVYYRPQRIVPALGGMFGAGILSGMLGIGSGAFKVLVMDNLMRLPIKVSTTTSNFMLGVTAAASAGMYFSRGDIQPGIAAPVALGIVAGTTLGTRLLRIISGPLLRRIFVVVLMITGLQMLWKGLMGGVS